MEKLMHAKEKSGEVEKIKKLLAHLQKSNEKVKVGFASDIGAAMLFIQQIPEVKSLIKMGKPAATLLAWEFEKDTLNPLKYRYDSEQDALLACLAYIIMETRTHEAVPVLIRFLKRNWNKEEKYFYSLPLVARTLWSLTGQPEIPEYLSTLERRELILKQSEEWLEITKAKSKQFDMTR